MLPTVKRFNNVRAEVLAHPMCYDLIECARYYTVVFPEGFRVGGARASKDLGKANALELLVPVLEREWGL